MLDVMIKKYLRRCLDCAGYKCTLFVDKANIANVKDVLKDIKPEYDASFEFGDFKNINKGLTIKGNESVFRICSVSNGKLSKKAKFNCALIDSALKGMENELIFPLAETYDDGTKDGIKAMFLFIDM